MATAVVAGKSVRLKFSCMPSKFSGKHFVRFYPSERQQTFFDGHIKAFEFFGSIFPVLIYGNLTTTVRKVHRLEQENCHKFRVCHSFEASAVNLSLVGSQHNPATDHLGYQPESLLSQLALQSRLIYPLGQGRLLVKSQ